MSTDETTAAPAARAPRAAAFGFVFATALMNAVSFGIMIPILPNLLKHFAHGDTASASEWNVLFATTWGAMQFVCGPVLGMLSDRYGRRPVMLISIFGLCVDFLFMAFAPTLAWLYLGRVINGMTAASFSTANAYVADITPPERRARNFGIMGSAIGFGFVIGPSIGGALGEINLRLPFMLAAGLCLINGIYGALVLPESLPPDRRTPAMNWRRANPLGSLAFLRERGELLGLASANFLWQFAQASLPAIFVLYTGYRYGWTPGILGLTFLATGTCQILVQFFVVSPVVKRFGERGAVLLGTGFGALSFAMYALADRPWLYLAAMPVFAMTGLIQPGILGLMTRRVGPQNQGQLQGSLQSLQGIASMLGPVVFGLTFAWSIRHEAVLHMPGLAILGAAGLLALSFALSLKVARPIAGPAEAVVASP